MNARKNERRWIFSAFGTAIAVGTLIGCASMAGPDGETVGRWETFPDPNVAAPGSPSGGSPVAASDADAGITYDFSSGFSVPAGAGDRPAWAQSATTPSRGTPNAKPTVERSSSIDPRLGEVLTATHDEVWIIARSRTVVAFDGPQPRAGTLYYMAPNAMTGEQSRAMLPLQRTSVTANITGFVSSVDVKQTFANPSSTPLEVVYAFPLPDNAAVSEFVMTIGNRNIRGIIREREEANRIYASAKEAGFTASLLTQERPNIFTQHVANVEAGRSVDINIRYFGTLAFDAGAFELVVPVAVGERFNPTASGGRNAEPAANAHAPCTLDVTVNLDAGVAIKNITSPSHRIDLVRPSGTSAAVRSVAGGRSTDKDFVLRWEVAGDGVQSALMVGPSINDRAAFSLMLIPPQRATKEDRRPLDIVYVLDRSGSMAGEPMRQAVAAIRSGLDGMRSDEFFQIVDFSDSTGGLGSKMLPANRENISSAERYLARLQSGGGTHMLPGLGTALALPGEASHRRVVAFLTDGFIGNEVEVLRVLDQRLNGATVFSFGVGGNPNRFLMNEMAVAGRGAATYLASGGDCEERMDAFLEAARRPALRDLKIDFGSNAVTEVYPATAPELFAGRPVVISGRVAGTFSSPIRISGFAGDKPVSWEVSPAQMHQATVGSELEQIWARAKIADIARSGVRGTFNGDPVSEIRRTALEFGLMSPFTSYVAVDATGPVSSRQEVEVGRE